MVLVRYKCTLISKLNRKISCAFLGNHSYCVNFFINDCFMIEISD